MPDFVQHDLDGQGGDHAEAHNVYGMQMVRATINGLERLRPDERPVCITRSGWAGVQRYAMSWTGDNRSNWRNLWLSMPMVMNLGLSGLAHTGPDIGGYSDFATGELFTRWLQMGVFLPFLRSHTFVHSPDQEPWSWGEPYLSINRCYIELRYKLLPYLYTAFWQCAQAGLPIVRPLLLDYQKDPTIHGLDDQFLCGDAFLVAPVIEQGATHRAVYLPHGTWYDFWTDELFIGPAHIEVAAPLERLPLFVRAGSVVPMAPPMQYVGEKPVDVLTLHVYPGNGGGDLYEDDGRTWAFRDGAYRLTHYVITADGIPPRLLELDRLVEGCYTPTYQEMDVVIHGLDRLPLTITADDQLVNNCYLADDGRTVCFHVGPCNHLRIVWEKQASSFSNQIPT
jgi:alpha-glucosidase